ncbi:MAG: FMN-binding protein [Wenzhouxiangellaceae bacterium]
MPPRGPGAWHPHSLDPRKSASSAPPAPGWKPDRRGGEFDTLSGATITSAAVVDAVRQVLQWYQANRDRAFDIPADLNS